MSPPSKAELREAGEALVEREDGFEKIRRAFDALVAQCLELEAALKAKDEEIARLHTTKPDEWDRCENCGHSGYWRCGECRHVVGEPVKP